MLWRLEIVAQHMILLLRTASVLRVKVRAYSARWAVTYCCRGTDHPLAALVTLPATAPWHTVQVAGA